MSTFIETLEIIGWASLGGIIVTPLYLLLNWRPR